MTIMRRRLYFSLLEVLFVIALLGLISGFIAINVRKAVIQQRFYGDVAGVLNVLRLAQQVMLILNTDVKVKFNQQDEGLVCNIEFEDQISPQWKKEIQHKRPPLKLFADFLPSNPGIPQGLQPLRFFSGGSVMSQGVLLLSTHKDPDASGALKSYICLPGYPHFLTSQHEKPKGACNFPAQDAYNQRLTQLSVDEVRSLLSE